MSGDYNGLNGDNIKYDFIYTFGLHSTIIIKCKPLRFEDIVAYDIIKIPKDTTGTINSNYRIKTDTASLIKRSIAGGLVGGVPGAIIGGTSAEKEILNNTDAYSAAFISILKMYEPTHILQITLNDLKNPSLTVNMRGDTEFALKIKGIMDYILKKNKSNMSTT